ncbi:MAG: M28 family peptidase [Myxococcales bacterium]|nr:M28 family peptidase [Myxococcales bacterium]MCB9715681.1 M28 family peptidase [Myxococcales bacterium]
MDPRRLREDVERLSDDRLRGRPTPSPELDEAAAYLVQRFAELGLEPLAGAPDHRQRFECGGDAHPGPASNVLALLPGRDPAVADQLVMVSAHYDHVGERPGGEDSIYNGANDDASGVAAMLAIAELLAASPPRRSVLLVAFCGEERGLLGSTHYAAHPLLPLDRVVAQVNLEMLGRPDPDAPGLAWITGMERSELGEWLAAANVGTELRFVDAMEIGPVEGGAFERSDNYPLALQGVVAHSVSTGRLDALYHSPDDEADTLDYEGMAVLVEGIARGVHHLGEAQGQPGWIDPPE